MKKEILNKPTDFDRALINLFAENVNCNVQELNCPCNSCFHH